MRVSMSATGSVSIVLLLPGALGHAGNRALVRELAHADPAEAELAEHRAGPSAAVAAAVGADLVALRPRLLDHQRFLGQLSGHLRWTSCALPAKTKERKDAGRGRSRRLRARPRTRRSAALQPRSECEGRRWGPPSRE